MRLRSIRLVTGLITGLAIGLAACWRDAPPPEPPRRSFVARVSALTDLQRGIDALAQRTQVTMHRIVGLASEAEREALHVDVVALEHEVMRLAAVLDRAREDGADPVRIRELAQKLGDSMFGVGQLRAELRHARTTAELEAFEELKRKLEGLHDPGSFGPGPRSNTLAPGGLRPDPKLPPTDAP
jgi:hypothetical protein